MALTPDETAGCTFALAMSAGVASMGGVVGALWLAGTVIASAFACSASISNMSPKQACMLPAHMLCGRSGWGVELVLRLLRLLVSPKALKCLGADGEELWLAWPVPEIDRPIGSVEDAGAGSAGRMACELCPLRLGLVPA